MGLGGLAVAVDILHDWHPMVRIFTMADYHKATKIAILGLDRLAVLHIQAIVLQEEQVLVASYSQELMVPSHHKEVLVASSFQTLRRHLTTNCPSFSSSFFSCLSFSFCYQMIQSFVSISLQLMLVGTMLDHQLHYA